MEWISIVLLGVIAYGVWDGASYLRQINIAMLEIRSGVESLESGLDDVKNDTREIAANTDSSPDLV